MIILESGTISSIILSLIDNRKARNTIANQINKINNYLSFPENVYTSKEQIEAQFEGSGGKNIEIMRSLSNVTEKVTEKPGQTIDITSEALKGTKKT